MSYSFLKISVSFILLIRFNQVNFSFHFIPFVSFIILSISCQILAQTVASLLISFHP